MVRLRYAALLFEETDNLREAENVLLKGVGSHVFSPAYCLLQANIRCLRRL